MSLHLPFTRRHFSPDSQLRLCDRPTLLFYEFNVFSKAGPALWHLQQQINPSQIFSHLLFQENANYSFCVKKKKSPVMNGSLSGGDASQRKWQDGDLFLILDGRFDDYTPEFMLHKDRVDNYHQTHDTMVLIIPLHLKKKSAVSQLLFFPPSRPYRSIWSDASCGWKKVHISLAR